MSNTPLYPQLLPRPFAESGNRRAVPDEASGRGQASFSLGFPPETQLPLNAGGVAPNRLDFQSMFHSITSMLFWAQSGGQWKYSQDCGYAQPAVVFHEGKLWWCVKENGPASANGAHAPGADENYWTEFLSAIAKMGGSSSIGVPVGTIITYYGVKAPNGFLACDGSYFNASTYPQLNAVLGKNILPDMRGYFVRGHDTRNTVDPSGSSRTIGSVQQDAIRNIQGEVYGSSNTGFDLLVPSGPFKNGTVRGRRHYHPDSAKTTYALGFDASLVVPTANENRPKNINLLYCIRHD